MCRKWIAWTMLLAVAAFVAGCGGSTPDDTAQQPAEPVAESVPPALAAPPPPPPAEEPPAPPAGEEPLAEPPADVIPPGMEAAPAMAGVGRKGRGYGSGLVATPIASLFRTKDRMQFVQVAHTLNIYKGMHGRMPKSHDEFMKEVVERYNLQLPELPAGHEYFYDAELAAKIGTVAPEDPDRMPLKVLRPE